MKKTILKLEMFFLNRSVNPSDYNFNIKLTDGTTVQNVCDSYVENEHDDAILFEDLTDDELSELEQLAEAVEVDEQKTQKRIED